MAKRSRVEHLNPRDCQARGGQARKAWWYENDGSIDVVIETESQGVVTQGIARIGRAALVRWIDRTAARKATP